MANNENKNGYFSSYISTYLEKLKGPYYFYRKELDMKSQSIIQKHLNQYRSLFSYRFSIEFFFGFLEQIPREILEREIKQLPSDQELYQKHVQELINYLPWAQADQNTCQSTKDRKEIDNIHEIKKSNLEFQSGFQDEKYISSQDKVSSQQSNLVSHQLIEPNLRQISNTSQQMDIEIEERKLIRTKEEEERRIYSHFFDHIQKSQNQTLKKIVQKHRSNIQYRSNQINHKALTKLFVHLFFLYFQEIRQLCYIQQDLWYITWELQEEDLEYPIMIKKDDLYALAQIAQIKKSNPKHDYIQKSINNILKQGQNANQESLSKVDQLLKSDRKKQTTTNYNNPQRFNNKPYDRLQLKQVSRGNTITDSIAAQDMRITDADVVNIIETKQSISQKSVKKTSKLIQKQTEIIISTTPNRFDYVQTFQENLFEKILAAMFFSCKGTFNIQYSEHVLIILVSAIPLGLFNEVAGTKYSDGDMAELIISQLLNHQNHRQITYIPQLARKYHNQRANLLLKEFENFADKNEVKKLQQYLKEFRRNQKLLSKTGSAQSHGNKLFAHFLLLASQNFYDSCFWTTKRYDLIDEFSQSCFSYSKPQISQQNLTDLEEFIRRNRQEKYSLKCLRELLSIIRKQQKTSFLQTLTKKIIRFNKYMNNVDKIIDMPIVNHNNCIKISQANQNDRPAILVEEELHEI